MEVPISIKKGGEGRKGKPGFHQIKKSDLNAAASRILTSNYNVCPKAPVNKTFSGAERDSSKSDLPAVGELDWLSCYWHFRGV